MDDTKNLNRWVTEIADSLQESSNPLQRMICTLDDAIHLLNLMSNDDIKCLLEKVYETSPHKPLRIKAGYKIEHKKYDLKRYNYQIQAQVYVHEWSLGNKLDLAELEIVFHDAFTTADRKKAGELLGKNLADILGNKVFYQDRSMDHRQQLTRDELMHIYDSSGSRRYRYKAGRQLGYSKLRICLHNFLKPALDI